ncbi:MAG TPA: hypothetical protein DIT08_00110 [Enterococcus sp.]|nr:hypothetical protein [Enterococcus sp.]
MFKRTPQSFLDALKNPLADNTAYPEKHNKRNIHTYHNYQIIIISRSTNRLTNTLLAVIKADIITFPINPIFRTERNVFGFIFQIRTFNDLKRFFY